LRAAVDSGKRWTPDYDDVADFYQRAAAIATPCDVLASYTFLRVLRSVRGLRILDLATGEGGRPAAEDRARVLTCCRARGISVAWVCCGDRHR
jgi:hypothetical protein